MKRAWTALWRPFPYWVSIGVTAVCFLVFAGSAVFTNDFLSKAYHRYDVTLEDATLSSCNGGRVGGGSVGQCHVQADVRFADGSTHSYTMSDGGTLNPSLNGNFDYLDTPTLADFNLTIGQSWHIWLAHRNDKIAYDYAPNTDLTVWVRLVCFFGFFIFGIRALVLRSRRNRLRSQHPHVPTG